MPEIDAATVNASDRSYWHREIEDEETGSRGAGTQAFNGTFYAMAGRDGRESVLIKLIQDSSIFIIPLAHKLKQLKEKLALVISSDLCDFLESYFWVKILK